MTISSPTISPSIMQAKRVVIKVGSALIAPNRTGCEKKHLSDPIEDDAHVALLI